MKWRPEEFLDWLERIARIPGTAGQGEIKLVPNKAQVKLIREGDAFKGIEGWTVALKARQLGITTILLFFAYWLSHEREGISILIVTPTEDPTGLEIIAKWRAILGVLERTPGSKWAGALKNDSKSETTFANGSRIAWHHIGGSDVVADATGRGGTYALCIFTELAFPYDADLAWRAIDALEPALERAHAPIIVDSTPGAVPGAGECYRDLAQRAIEGIKGQAVFLPWWLYHGYRREVTDAGALWESLTAEELALVKEHHLDAEQIAWRRSKIEKRPGESRSQALKRFLRKYLERPQDALLGEEQDSLWDGELMDALSLKERLEGFEAPLTAAEVAQEMPGPLRIAGRDLMLCHAWGEITDTGEGYVRIWEPPIFDGGAIGRSARRARYFMGVDPSEGLPSSDPQAIAVLDWQGRIVALARLRVSKTRLAAYVQRLLLWYQARCLIEAQHGELIHRLIRVSVAQLELEGEARKGGSLSELGCLTTPAGGVRIAHTGQAQRRLYVDGAFGVLSSSSGCPDVQTLQEMRDLFKDSKGKIRARPGAGRHDDLFIAIGLAEHTRREAQASAARSKRRRPGERGGSRPGRRRYDYLRG